MKIFEENYFDEAMLEKEATGCFCAKHQIMPRKLFSALLSRFEKMIYREFPGGIEIISLSICKRPEREFNFVIPIEKLAFLTS